MVRRSKNVDSWIAEHDPALRQIAATLRNIILEATPQLKESIKWSNPLYEKEDRVLFLSATENYVRLGFFNGFGLTDPGECLEKEGKKLCYVKIKALEDIDKKQLVLLIREAAALDEMWAVLRQSG